MTVTERRSGARRWLRRIVLALVALEVVYLVAGNAFLWTSWGPHVVNRRPNGFSATWSRAFTIVPGLVHVHGLELGGSGRRVDWHTTIDHADAWFWLPSLFARHVHVLGAGVSGAEVELDLEPKRGAPKHRRTGHGWTVTLGGLHATGLRRVRLDEYEIAGAGRLSGWARFQVRGPMALRLRRLAFDGATVRGGGTEAARQVYLESSFALAPYRVGDEDLSDFLAKTSASVQLHATTDNLGFLALYLRRVPWLRLDGNGELTADVDVDSGALRPGSTVDLRGTEIEARFFGFSAHGHGTVHGAVDDDGVALHSRLADVSLVRASDGASLLTGEDLDVAVRSASRTLTRPPEGLAGRVRLPPARVDHLGLLAPYLPPALRLRVDGGSADLAADLAFDTEAGSGKARLDLDARNVRGAFGDATFSTDLTLHAISPHLDLLAGHFDVAGSRLAFDDTRIESGGKVRASGWSASFRVPHGRMSIAPPGRRRDSAPASLPISFVTAIEAEMESSAPVVVLLEQRVPKLGWFDRLLTIPDVAVSGTVSAQGSALGLGGLHVTGGKDDQLEILADLALDGPASHGAAYVRYRALAAAVSLDGEQRDWMLVRAKEKYEKAVAGRRH